MQRRKGNPDKVDFKFASGMTARTAMLRHGPSCFLAQDAQHLNMNFPFSLGDNLNFRLDAVERISSHPQVILKMN